MNPQATDPLAGLRDIHLPPDPSWWPPAPGWWLLAVLALLLAAVSVPGWRRYRQRGAPYRAARRELQGIRSRYRVDGDGAAAARRVSVLLRRVVLVSRGNREAAGLVGEQWLAFLDRVGATDAFSLGPGRVLESAAWSRNGDDPDALLDLAETTLERMQRGAGDARKDKAR